MPSSSADASAISEGKKTDHTIDSATGKQVPTSGVQTLSDIVKDSKGFRVGFYEGNLDAFHVYTPYGMYDPPDDVLTFIANNNCVFLSADEQVEYEAGNKESDKSEKDEDKTKKDDDKSDKDSEDTSDKDSEDKSEKDSEESYDDVAVHTWTERDQKSLDYLKTGILFNADILDALLKKKIASTFADGESLNEVTEDTIPMTTTSPRQRRGKTFTKRSLTAKGIDMEYVAVKWAGTASTIAMYDTLYTYACDGTEFVIRPVVMGGKRAHGGEGSKANAVSKMEKLNELTENLTLAFLRSQMNPTPLVSEMMNVLAGFKQKADIKPERAIGDIIAQMSVEQLKLLQGALVGTHTDKKVGSVSRILFADA